MLACLSVHSAECGVLAAVASKMSAAMRMSARRNLSAYEYQGAMTVRIRNPKECEHLCCNTKMSVLLTGGHRFHCLMMVYYICYRLFVGHTRFP